MAPKSCDRGSGQGCLISKKERYDVYLLLSNLRNLKHFQEDDAARAFTLGVLYPKVNLLCIAIGVCFRLLRHTYIGTYIPLYNTTAWASVIAYP